MRSVNDTELPFFSMNQTILFATNNEKSFLFKCTDGNFRAVDLVATDVWASMGSESENEKRHHVFKSYQINQHLIEKAKSDAIFMHCLPAKREQEVSSSVIDGPQSVVWDQAENRLHSQKALLSSLSI